MQKSLNAHALKMTIYVPVDQEIRKALVLFQGGPHNYPIHPKAKPNFNEPRQKLFKAIKATGDLEGLTPMKPMQALKKKYSIFVTRVPWTCHRWALL